MGSNKVESVIGFLVLLVAGWFLLFAYENSDASASVSGYELIARFDKVDGLGIGSDVRLGGIKIGTVVAQEIDENYNAVVRFSVRGDLKLPLDTAAYITSASLLGGNYLALTPGGEEDVLIDGDEISETQGAVDLVGLIGKFVNDN